MPSSYPSTTLTQQQIKQLYNISKKFKDIPQFEIEQTAKSGIGPSTEIVFEFNKNKVTIDITDVSNW